jgi:hypothetical protein
MSSNVAGTSKLKTSTPVGTSHLTAETSTKTALEVIENCVKNGQDLLKACAKVKDDGSVKSAALKQMIDRVQEDTKAIVKLKEKFVKLHESVRDGIQESIKQDFVEIINGEISKEKLQLFSDLLCLTETSNVKKKFQESERELKKIDKNSLPDENTKKFADMLVTRNQKIIECLEYVYKSLPKLLAVKGGDDDRFLEVLSVSNRTKAPKKLYILGENLTRPPQEHEFSFMGNITIEGGAGDLQPSRFMSHVQPQYRIILSGYLEDDEGNLEEVALKLMKPVGDLMNFTEVGVHNLTAKIELDGQVIDQLLPVIEIDVFDGQKPTEEAAKVIAIVENERTGMNQEVEVALVPTSPQQTVHGRIVGLQSAGGRQVLHDSLRVPRRQQRYNPDVTNIYENRFKKLTRNLNTPNRSENLDDISEPSFDDQPFAAEVSGRSNRNFSAAERSQNQHESRRFMNTVGEWSEWSENLDNISAPNFDEDSFEPAQNVSARNHQR